MRRHTKPLLGLVLAMFAAGSLLSAPAIAQDGESAPAERATKKTPAMREKVYKVLSEAQELAEANNSSAALAKLNSVQKMTDLNSYERAQMWNFYGFIYFGQENYREASRAYENVLKQEALPEAMETTTVYALGQLSFVTEDYQGAVNYLNRWFKTANNPGAEAYVLLGQGYYQLGKYKEAITPVQTAIRIAGEKGQKVKENWWLLLRTFYFELNDYPQMLNSLEKLLAGWPKKEYWLQVSSVYGELGKDTRQLIAYEIAHMQGFLTRGGELVTLAQLYLQENVPHKAAKILDDGIKKGTIDATALNYRLLSQAWQLSAEDEKAIPSLEQAARLSGDGELDYRLAQAFFNLDRYDESVAAGRKALSKGGLKRADQVSVLIGMTLYNQKKYGEARDAFQVAQSDSRSARLAAQWINHCNSEQDRERQLAEATAGR